MPQCDLLLTAEWIVTQDDERRVFENGAVAVLNGVVATAGPAAELRAAWQPAAVRDLGRCIVLPGLVNGHTHAAMTIFRGVADDLPLMQWLTEHIWPVEQNLTGEIVHAAALFACAEMIRTGTTCFSDMYLIEAQTARAVEACGMRAVLAEGIFAFPSPAYAELSEGWRLVEELHATYRNHPRIRTAVMPHAVYTTGTDILKHCVEVARRHDCPLMLHAAESAQETAQVLEQTGARPVAFLDEVGALEERTVLFHAVDLNDGEIARIAETGTKTVHCPQSNMKLASGMSPVQKLLDAGVTVALGTDGAASNNDLNMFGEMTSAALLSKVRRHDPTALPAQQVLDMATVHGAAAFAWPELGRIAPGLPADLIALDATEPNLAPVFNPVSNLVYAASGHEVRLTMVGGEVLYDHGRYLTLDYPALLEEIAGLRSWVLRRKNGA